MIVPAKDSGVKLIYFLIAEEGATAKDLFRLGKI